MRNISEVQRHEQSAKSESTVNHTQGEIKMGCDIHVCCEVKNKEGGWRTADRFYANHYGDGDMDYQIDPIYRDRHYALFTALASDVRRYNDEQASLGEAKGLPHDMSSHTKAAYERWELDAHNASHYTLAELYAFQDANKHVTLSGFISPEAAAELENGKTPETWCQGTTDKTWVHRQWTFEQDVMADLVSAIEKRADSKFWLSCRDGRVPPDKAENIRIVFWFDN
jgi:hypothetical protein